MCIRDRLLEADGADTFNLGTGTRTTVDELLETTANCVGQTPVEVQDGTPEDQLGVYAHVARLQEVFGRRDFISLEQGVKFFYESEIKQPTALAP